MIMTKTVIVRVTVILVQMKDFRMYVTGLLKMSTVKSYYYYYY